MAGPERSTGGGLRAASAAMEAAARERGLAVQRLDPETILCHDGDRPLLFYGMAGPGTSKLAQVLCDNVAWLRAHLARHGIPVIPTRLVALDDTESAHLAAEQLGYPVTVRLTVPGERGTVVESPDALGEWLQAAARDPDSVRARITLEHRPDGEVVDVTVLGGQVVATAMHAKGYVDSAGQLAIAAPAALPGLTHGTVRVVVDKGEPLVDCVGWTPLDECGVWGSVSATVASAVLEVEQF